MSVDCVTRDRAALEALYRATDGPNWRNNDHWLSAMPLDSWSGLHTDGNGCVIYMFLANNDMEGELPDELGDLRSLTQLWIAVNPQLSGGIPESIGNLRNLEELWLDENRLEGAIPAEMGNLVNLRTLNLQSNHLSGAIPAEMGNLVNLRTLKLQGNRGNNRFEGCVPAALRNVPDNDISYVGRPYC